MGLAAAMSTSVQVAESCTQHRVVGAHRARAKLVGQVQGIGKKWSSGGGGWGWGCWIVEQRVAHVLSEGCRAGGGQAVGWRVASPRSQHAALRYVSACRLVAVHRPANAGELALQVEVHARRAQKVTYQVPHPDSWRSRHTKLPKQCCRRQCPELAAGLDTQAAPRHSIHEAAGQGCIQHSMGDHQTGTPYV